MRNNILIRLLVATALLILAIPVVASAQYYNRDRYDRADSRMTRLFVWTIQARGWKAT